MAIPVNIDYANAISLGGPSTSTTQNVRDDDTGIAYTVWYKYTETVKDRVIDVRFYGIIGGGAETYHPRTRIYTNPTNPFAFTETIDNGQAQLPIKLGQTYYYEIKTFDTTLAAALLHVEFLFAPDEATIPAGRIFIRAASIPFNFISDEGFTGLPGGFIDASASAITAFKPYFIVGESGDILPATGRMLFVDEAGSLTPIVGYSYTVYLFNPDFSIRTSLTFEFHSTPQIRTHLPTNKFYILDRGSSTIGVEVPVNFRSVTAEGVPGTHHFTTAGTYGCTAFAVNNAETICYMAGIGASILNSSIARWDMVGNTFLSNLAPVVTDYRVTDILVLADDSVIASYYKPSSPRDTFVRRYNSAGTILNTYTFTFGNPLASGLDTRLGYASDATPAFWAFFHLASGARGWGDIRRIRVSDGAQLVTSITPSSDFEFYEEAAPPTVLTSDSCPIIEIRFAASPPPPGGPTHGGLYTIVPGKTDDTIIVSGVATDLKIPDPTFKTGLLG